MLTNTRLICIGSQSVSQVLLNVRWVLIEMSADIIIGSQVLVRYVRKSFYMSQVAHQAGAYPSFSSMKQEGEFLFPLDKMLVHHRLTPSIKFASTHLYPLVEKGAVRVKYLGQEHNTMSPARA